MTESFTLPLFVYLCTTCVALWLCVPWKRCGRGVMSRSYFTACPSENTTFRQTRTRKKRTENLANTFSDALAILNFFFAGWRWQFFILGDKSHLRWQVPLDKLVNVTSWVDKLTCVLPSYPSSNHLTSYNLSSDNLSSWLVKSTCTILISRKCRTLILQNLIIRTRSCGTGFITQSMWFFHFHLTTLVRWKWFVPQLYQFRRGISGGPALKYFYMIDRGGRREIAVESNIQISNISTLKRYNLQFTTWGRSPEWDIWALDVEERPGAM